MRGVGLPGGPKGGSTYKGGGAKARQQAYRQSEAGRQARKMRAQNPENRAKLAAKREIKRKMHGGT
jgi:hypothetical protein